MKKIIACLMAFIMIISLCACGNNQTDEQSSTGDGIIGETSFSGNTFIINGEPREVADYYPPQSITTTTTRKSSGLS